MCLLIDLMYLGWGDRTRKIVAAFLLSLALNRTFLLDMSWPCSIESFLEPNWISWSVSSHPQVRNHSSSVKITSLSSQTSSDLLSFHLKYSVLLIQTTNIAYFDLIRQHGELSQSLFHRFGLKREHIQIITLYPLFFELLIRLKSHLQEKLDRLNLHDDQRPLLCGHLRIGRNPTNPKDVVFPQREKMNITVLNFLLARPGRVFITTDSGDVQQLARRLFAKDPSRLILINGTIAHIDRDRNSLACQSLEKTILDFHALTFCHLAVISKSSFGHLAIIRRVNPYEELFLYCNGIQKINNAEDYNQYKYATC